MKTGVYSVSCWWFSNSIENHGLCCVKCWFCWFCCHQPSDLVYLILLSSVHSLRIRWRPQSEFRITEVAVSIDVVKTLPHDLLLCQEALVCHQEVQLVLETTTHKHLLTSYHALDNGFGTFYTFRMSWILCLSFIDQTHGSAMIVNCLKQSAQASLPLQEITGEDCPSCVDSRPSVGLHMLSCPC